MTKTVASATSAKWQYGVEQQETKTIGNMSTDYIRRKYYNKSKSHTFWNSGALSFSSETITVIGTSTKLSSFESTPLAVTRSFIVTRKESVSCNCNTYKWYFSIIELFCLPECVFSAWYLSRPLYTVYEELAPRSGVCEKRWAEWPANNYSPVYLF